MISTIVVSSDSQKSLDDVLTTCKKNKIDPIDITSISSENSIGIADIRKIQEKIYLKPIKSQKKAIVINQAQLLTAEAQNALLKVLEEPPLNTELFLISNQIDSFLPTIISRCKIINLDPKEKAFPQEALEKTEETIDRLKDMQVGERLKLAQDLSKDIELMKWFSYAIFILRNQMLENPTEFETEKIIKFNRAMNTLSKTNINPRFVLENLFLSI